MDIKKCDMCKKEIKEIDDCVYVRFTLWNSAEFCSRCALPIMRFLQKNKFLDKDNKAIKKS